MALTSGEMTAADIAAVVGNRNNDGFGWGGDGGLITILLILALFGNGGFGFGGGSEFLCVISGENANDVWRIVSEAMEALKIIEPGLYKAVIKRLKELKSSQK